MPGAPVGIWPSWKSPFLLLPDSEDELSGRVSSTLRSGARRKLRLMQKRANVQIDRIESGDLALVLDDFFTLERNSWKGRNGTACDQDKSTRAFYTRLAAVAAEKEWLSLFRLTLNGETAAFHFGLTYDGVYMLPKLAFDEKFGEFSPGLVLMHEILRDSIQRQLRAIDFLGGDDEWKTRWCRSLRPHYWLYVFAKTFKGHMLHSLKFKWAAVAKDVVGWQA